MESLNLNKAKKVRVRFPNLVSGKLVIGECERLVMKLPEIQDINNRIYSDMFGGASGMSSGAKNLPHIEGFNATWINNDRPYGQYVDAQFTFASSEEKKVMKIVNKYSGKIVNIDTTMNQNQIEETNLTGETVKVEQVNEILEGKTWY